MNTYKTSLKADKELGGEGGSPAAHWHRGVQDHDPTTHAPPKQARNTNETCGPPSRNIR